MIIPTQRYGLKDKQMYVYQLLLVLNKSQQSLKGSVGETKLVSDGFKIAQRTKCK